MRGPIRSLSDAVQDIIDLVNSVRFVSSTLICQRRRGIHSGLREDCPEEFRPDCRQTVPSTGRNRAVPRGTFLAPQVRAPGVNSLQKHYVGYEHLIDNVDRVYHCADTSEKLS
jgi:hypothetical protein